jgi:hypothetical protein
MAWRRGAFLAKNLVEHVVDGDRERDCIILVYLNACRGL